MALRFEMANGLEPPCHHCQRHFKPEDLKVREPSKLPARHPDTFTIGGRAYQWVHPKCSPLHGSKRSNHKKRK